MSSSSSSSGSAAHSTCLALSGLRRPWRSDEILRVCERFNGEGRRDGGLAEEASCWLESSDEGVLMVGVGVLDGLASDATNKVSCASGVIHAGHEVGSVIARLGGSERGVSVLLIRRQGGSAGCSREVANGGSRWARISRVGVWLRLVAGWMLGDRVACNLALLMHDHC